MKDVTFIIPTYKNHEQLIKNIVNNRKYWKKSKVIIVNDFPEEDLTNDLSKFEEVTLIQNEKNLGFAGTIDCGIRAATSPYIILLNSDVLLKDGSCMKATERFEKNNQLFAVTFAQEEKNKSIVGKNKMFWKFGLVYHSKDNNTDSGSTAWAEGGSSMIDRKKYEILEGFDSIYSPFYWEDIDLSYRARKAGYEIYFDSSIVVEHHHESTIGKFFDNEKIKTVSFRNQFLFLWKNIDTPAMMLEHILLLIPNIVYYLLKGEWMFLKGLLFALTKIVSNSKIRHHKTIISDKELLCS